MRGQMAQALKASLEQERRSSELLRAELLNATAHWGVLAPEHHDARAQLQVQQEVMRGLSLARFRVQEMERERDSALQAARLAYAHVRPCWSCSCMPSLLLRVRCVGAPLGVHVACAAALLPSSAPATPARWSRV